MLNLSKKEEWIANRQELNKVQANTVDRYNSVFNRHFKNYGHIKVGNISPADFEDFLEHQTQTRKSQQEA